MTTITHPARPLDEQSQDLPGSRDRMNPRREHVQDNYRGFGRLSGMAALITGADSGIGRGVAVSCLCEHDRAERNRALVEEAGQRAMLPGDPAARYTTGATLAVTGGKPIT